jgi:hypothetical protein
MWPGDRLVRPAREAQPQQSPMSTPKPWLSPESVEPGALDDREIGGYILWGVLAVVVAGFELLAAYDGDATPWPTLSSTAGTLQANHHWTALPILGALVVLGARIVFYPWPYRKPES